LIVCVALKYVSARFKQLPDNVYVAAVGCEVQGSPLMNTTSSIHIKLFFIDKQRIKLGNCCNTFVLALPDSCVQRCPVV